MQQHIRALQRKSNKRHFQHAQKNKGCKHACVYACMHITFVSPSVAGIVLCYELRTCAYIFGMYIVVFIIMSIGAIPFRSDFLFVFVFAVFPWKDRRKTPKYFGVSKSVGSCVLFPFSYFAAFLFFSILLSLLSLFSFRLSPFLLFSLMPPFSLFFFSCSLPFSVPFVSPLSLSSLFLVSVVCLILFVLYVGAPFSQQPPCDES